jgi:hypothetical protein
MTIAGRRIGCKGASFRHPAVFYGNGLEIMPLNGLFNPWRFR